MFRNTMKTTFNFKEDDESELRYKIYKMAEDTKAMSDEYRKVLIDLSEIKSLTKRMGKQFKGYSDLMTATARLQNAHLNFVKLLQRLV